MYFEESPREDGSDMLKDQGITNSVLGSGKFTELTTRRNALPGFEGFTLE